VFGFIRYDNTQRLELPFPYNSHHFHSNTRDLIVGDGSQGERVKWVLLYERDGDQYKTPRVLCEHRSSRHIQITHVHPRFSLDGKQVLFTSDRSGYGQVYLAQMPEDVSTLPKIEDV